ncbi:polycomb group RING finger protein 3 isoform X2 [Ixodes scapularis]|uniref:polycomb group RING finger protein 3 isoform X2 n=1 Tax=Ixodes scapularis TaxID=6945 RepID=UPI001A9CCA44|nr:polycomb group RING finger protein 3 isoform X2 [Ixodes scapularis]XP_042143136.1 polycomb group RING finger protein 3 isoform X2 [Ixodes scapularis]
MVFIPQEFLQRQMERRIRLKTLNNHIICKICKGYLIDATTVTECLHTFCKSCLVKHLEDNNTCPTCEIVIHQSYPLQYISYDRTMQDIVYKLVPNLQYNEIKRERDFYRRKGLPCPKVHTPGMSNTVPTYHDCVGIGSGIQSPFLPSGMLSEKDAGSKASSSKEDEADCHRSDEQVNILLESSDSVQLKQMRRKFIRCSAQATITHLKKFIAKKLFNNLEKYKEVEILCNQEILGKDHTLKFVYVTRWRFKDPPLKLYYRPKMEL